MLNSMIKICGIRDAEMARKAALAGANFIGLVFHPGSPRALAVDEAVLISKASKKGGALPVAVFVHQTDNDMRAICEATDIQIIQLHGAIAKQHHHLLPDAFQRIYVLDLKENGEVELDKGFHYLKPYRDFILIDHEEPGLGKMVGRRPQAEVLGMFPWLLAGGLNSHNVSTLINTLKPNGVDVSSGVERAQGQKDICLIQKFITTVRGYDASYNDDDNGKY